MFCEVDVKLNDVLLSGSNNMYAYRSYLETLLSYGPSAKQSQLTSELYYKDVAGAMEESNPLDAAAVNTGMKKRHALISDGHAVNMIRCIHSDLFFHEKYLPCHVGMRIKLVRSKDAFCLLSNAPNPGFNLKIIDYKLLIRKVKLSPSVFIALAKAREVGNAKYVI
jgi:hypothetical protein